MYLIYFFIPEILTLAFHFAWELMNPTRACVWLNSTHQEVELTSIIQLSETATETHHYNSARKRNSDHAWVITRVIGMKDPYMALPFHMEAFSKYIRLCLHVLILKAHLKKTTSNASRYFNTSPGLETTFIRNLTGTSSRILKYFILEKFDSPRFELN